MMTSTQRSVIGLAALLALAATQACGSDTTDAGSTPAGGATGHAGSAGSGVAGSGSSLAGSGGTATAGSGAGGAAAGSGPVSSGGATGGSGGSPAGSGGATAGSGGASGGAGGGSAVTFAQIKTLFGTSCGVGNCHNKDSKNLDYQGTTDLHGLLTTAIPAGIAHCVGSTPVKAGDTAGSFLLSVVKAGTACPVGGGNIGRMPDKCSTAANSTNKCLTDVQIKLISDWIAAGAPG